MKRGRGDEVPRKDDVTKKLQFEGLEVEGQNCRSR